MNFFVKIDIETREVGESIFKKFRLADIPDKGLFVDILLKHIHVYKKNLLVDSLSSYSWQLSAIEKEKSGTNLSKLDKAEIKLNLLIAKENSCVDNKLIKLNYFEFSEIFENLKKIDGQLQAFK